MRKLKQHIKNYIDIQNNNIIINIMDPTNQTDGVTVNIMSTVSGMSVIGELDCSTNPNYPVGLKGDSYFVSVSGKIGGLNGKDVSLGDLIVCKNNNSGGTEIAVGDDWFVLEMNLNNATETKYGYAEIATQTEVNDGIDDSRFVTPQKLLTKGNTPLYAIKLNGATRSIAINSFGARVLTNGSVIVPATGTYLVFTMMKYATVNNSNSLLDFNVGVNGIRQFGGGDYGISDSTLRVGSTMSVSQYHCTRHMGYLLVNVPLGASIDIMWSSLNAQLGTVYCGYSTIAIIKVV